MNFNDYRQRLNANDVHTNGQRHSYEAQDIIEHTWYDDPASTVGYLYDYYHDDEPIKNIGLHPENSNTKTMVELKYMLSSYRTLNKDEVDSRIMFKPSYKCNVSYYKDKFEKPTSGVFPVGLYLDLKNEDGIWKRWLVVSTATANNNDFPTWSILPCGHKFQWVHDGKKYEMWGVERSQSSYTSGVWLDRVYESPDNITKGILPYNDISKTLFYNTRIILDASLIEPLAWRVTKVEPFAMRGNIMYTFKQDIFNEHTDVIECDDDGNVVGMWADLVNDFNLPSQPNKPEPTPYGVWAELTYAGRDPHIKVGGSYKSITIEYYSNTTEIYDHTPGDWSFEINSVDVSDYIKILETDSNNTIKIKFLGDEEWLENILVIKNTRQSDGVTAELQLEIVSL